MKYGYILVCADELPCIAVCEYGFGITHHESRVDSQEGELTLFPFDCESVFTLHIRAIKLRQMQSLHPAWSLQHKLRHSLYHSFNPSSRLRFKSQIPINLFQNVKDLTVTAATDSPGRSAFPARLLPNIRASICPSTSTAISIGSAGIPGTLHARARRSLPAIPSGRSTPGTNLFLLLGLRAASRAMSH